MTAPATLPINIDDEKVRRRFDSYVDRRGYDECWLWNGPRVRSGHGQVWDGKRNVAAHRMALALSGVEIDGKLACHKCANPGCVNPHHLYAGTFQTNIDDAIAAGNKYGRPAAKGEQESFLTADGVKLKGLFHRSPNAGNTGNPVVVLMYEPGKEKDMLKGDWDGLIDKLNTAGFHVFRFDWRGHGQSTEIADPLGDNTVLLRQQFSGFWANTITGPANQNFLKGFAKGKAPKNTFKVKEDFKTAKDAANYFPYYVNDLAAVRLHLDIKNDNNVVNSSSIYLIGAGDTAALGMMWLAAEWKRPGVAPSFAALPGLQYKITPMPVAVVVDPPAGQDIAGAVWLTAGQPAAIHQGNLKAWALESPKLRDTNEMLFLFGATDPPGKTAANVYYKNVLVADGDKKLGLLPVKQTFQYPVPNTKLSGAALLGGMLPTEQKVLDYLAERQKARQLITTKKRNYVSPYYVDVSHYMTLKTN